MTWISFAWDLPRNSAFKCSLFCTKFILKTLYLAENSFYKRPLFLRETALRGVGVRGGWGAALFSHDDNAHVFFFS